MRPSKWFSCNLFILVAIFPLTEIVLRSGLKIFIWAFLLGLDVPIMEPFGIDLNDVPFFVRRISEAAALSKIEIILKFLSNFAGTSFKLWTAISAESFNNADSKVLIKRPLPPIWWRGLSVKSPSELMGISSTLIFRSNCLIWLATYSAWNKANGDFLVAILIFIFYKK